MIVVMTIGGLFMISVEMVICIGGDGDGGGLHALYGALSDEVIKETLKSKLSNMQLSKTAVEFLTN